MDLNTKKASAAVDVEAIKAAAVELTWSTPQDFDLAALYRTKAGGEGLIFFNNLGDLNAPPFIRLNKDAGVGDKVAAGGNSEQLRITKFDDLEVVHILTWDFGAIERGAAARFAGSDVAINLTDSNNKKYSAKLDTGDLGNVAAVMTIKNGPTGGEIINTSKVGLIKQFSKTEQLWDIVNS